ncbi:MAG: hypothetical protein A2722_01825 [Candidatus Doudnabacteria bacterium RIFCSPHIGHO2_01_FULL_50_11]|uniref:Uncharacterized protein n=1 Tax=Candidatus Doudnabacteria bacterium RIFCSPHIGHO2_01_FULL_50_11 TaxID=1817828 RepID=A0A1F5PNE6_9BACT|nr:MAG: hypothetical protein A2722_01825 [Candidatus Doudnabacteria bacterium RIFCSPHIGHO2_01_FULL_50_11]HLC44642.1 hypothetical protein [Patescibacteria group bacterium]
MGLVCVALIVIAASALVVLQHRSESLRESVSQLNTVSEWQTYRNTSLGFEIRHPVDWAVTAGESGSEAWLIENGSNSTSRGEIYISVQKNIDSLSLVKLSQSEKDREGGYSILKSYYDPDKQIEIDGETAIQMRILKPDTPPMVYDKTWVGTLVKTTVFVSSGNIFTIQLTSPRDAEKNEKLYDQVLATFKFISQQATTDIAGWKTYRNEIDGFEIQYPATAVTTTQNTVNHLAVATNKQCVSISPYNSGNEYVGCQEIEAWTDQVKANFEGGTTRVLLDSWAGEEYNFTTPQDYMINDVRIHIPQGELYAQVFRGGTWYKVHLRYHLDEQQKGEELFNQIISTFKFTK